MLLSSSADSQSTWYLAARRKRAWASWRGREGRAPDVVGSMALRNLRTVAASSVRLMTGLRGGSYGLRDVEKVVKDWGSSSEDEGSKGEEDVSLDAVGMGRSSKDDVRLLVVESEILSVWEGCIDLRRLGWTIGVDGGGGRTGWHGDLGGRRRR